jgi:hypothetical protein
MNYKVNDVIFYPVPGAVYNRIENTFPVKVKITNIYSYINTVNGVIVDMEILEVDPGKHITGKLLDSKNYFVK